MRVGTMTFHTALNFGAVLQTYALYKTIKDNGHDVKVIDYRAPFNEKRFAPKPISYFFNIRTIYNILFRNGYEIYYKDGFQNFLNQYLELTKPVYDKEGLTSLSSSFDIFITGSDQVWNLACTEGDEMFYLPFVEEQKKRNSYAASIGYSKLPISEVDRYRRLMMDFCNISVREQSALDIVKNLTGKNVELVLDPTFLLDKAQWEKIADYTQLPKDCRYLLLYVMAEDNVLIKEAQICAKKNNLKVVYITQRFFKLGGALNLRNVTPEQWLGLFLKADIVVTNSFHGLVFSINFNRQFITRYIPRSITNSRIETILSLLNLHFRRIDSESYENVGTMEYSVINKELQKLRNKSLNYLDKILNND